jgi:hypothetical protein
MNDILTQVEDENCKYEVYETLITWSNFKLLTI